MNREVKLNQHPSPGSAEASAKVLARVDLPIARATGLPNESYVNDSSFQLDRDRVMGTGWACIGFIDQLPEPNFVYPVDFMGLPLLLVRGKADYKVFHNVCSHRGLKLVDVPGANNGAVKCPYHSWTYGLDGKLKATPNIGGYGIHSHCDFDNSANGLREVRSAIWLGAIFVNLSGEAVDFDSYKSNILQGWSKFLKPESLDNFALSENESIVTLTVKSNWKLAVENYLESYHLPSVHPELNRVSPLDEHYYLEMFENGAGQGSLNYTRLATNGVSLPLIKEWPEEQINHAEYPVLYPNTFLGIHADQLFIQYLQPIDQQTTVEHVRIFYCNEGATSDDYREHREAIRDSWKSVFKEDIFAVERMQAGRLSPAFGGGAFSPVMDEPTHHFHKWVARKIAEVDSISNSSK